MGLFDTKYCDVCGNKIKLLGNKKLEDANLCKDCASKLSPWFTGRRHSSLEDIKAQLAYREENKAAVESFRISRTLGRSTKLYLDEDAKKFMVTSASDLKTANPDVLSFSQVTGCDFDIEERKTEVKREDKDGKEVSFVPPKYEFEYDFYITIFVDCPYFDDMRFRLNSSSVETGAAPASFRTTPDYKEYEALGNEIKQIMDEARSASRTANEPKRAVKCPHCLATTVPNERGCCEYCGGALNL